MTRASASLNVAVLLATRDGALYLREQMESYWAQSRRPDLLLISDDGSVDGTRDEIAAFRSRHPDLPIELFEGPRRGVAQNFFNLLRRTAPEIDVVALSDQDDVWLPDKLRRGLQALEDFPPDRPALYCGRTWECDDRLENRRLSIAPRRAPGFRHALVQNVAGGNTMMLNRAALDLVRKASLEAREVVVHDWWIYQIVTGAGGEVIYDPVPLLLYRQHGLNLIGANRGLRAKARRMRMMLSGRVRRWNTINIQALNASAHRLTPENRWRLAEFEACRGGPLWRRMLQLRRSGLYRQGLLGLLSLYATALLGRL